MCSAVNIAGSYREHPVGWHRFGEPAPDEILTVSLVLRRRESAPSPDLMQHFLSRDELENVHGADPADIEAVEAFAFEHQLSVVTINGASRVITIAGTFAALSAAFGADVELRQRDGKILRTRQGFLCAPESLASRIMAVLGLDQRPAGHPYHRFARSAGDAVAYTPRQVAQLYNFPQNKGKGQTIALIELGGGFRSSDLKEYWKQLGLSNVSTTAVSVDGARNSPSGDAESADSEVVLDIEVAGSVAPSSRVIVYFAPNTDQGFLDAINAAIHDRVHKPSVISISWGAPESEWIPQALNAFNAAFHDAALLGITVCVASGDNGSSDGENDGRDHVDFPASSPWVLACGGTTLIAKNGEIESETVWNNGGSLGATGGGVSAHFSKPAYQAKINVPQPTGTANPTGRGVPDVAGVADPLTGYIVLVDGQEGVIGGTSAVAPLWAALIALLNEQLGKNLGWFHRTLYGILAPFKALNDITAGANGDFHATSGWDPCTGLGSPNGQAILDLLKPASN
jgi:kumamolisin